MAIIKCKMCGGDMELTVDKTFGTCEFCGSTMTLPRIDDEQRAAAFNRGNHFRRIGEFDKALAVYERIVREDDTDAEAHWCAALCRFGIEYVEDPATYEWMPTCHRASFDSFLEDVDYKAALEHSEGITRRQYLKDGAKIAEVQRGILAASLNTEPYDVFICYKESDDSGNRTRDSIMAQEIYYQLTEQGKKVFFSRITLEDIPGTQYEPYIFAALNSAKVMVAVGTKPEHFAAVWVKNEWSRFLALMRKDHSRVLLPCYRDMDPYDLPEQLAVLQSYDMGKIGFIQDLIRGIAKVLDVQKPAPPMDSPAAQQTPSPVDPAPLLKRAFMFLEDCDWNSASEYCEKVLDIDPECAGAYLGKFLVKNKAMSLDNLSMKLIAKTDTARETMKEACPRDQGAESRAVTQFTVLGYLDEAAILSEFHYDRTYKSAVESRKAQLQDVQQIWENDKNMSRAIQFGDADFKAQIEQCRNAIQSVLETRLTKAMEQDASNVETISRKYAQKIEDAVNRVRALNEEAHAVKKALEEEAHKRAEEKRKREEEKRIAQRKREDEKRMALTNKTSYLQQLLAAGSTHTVGLGVDGMVQGAGCIGSENAFFVTRIIFHNLVTISAGVDHTVGLKKDGTVVATKYTGNPLNYYGQCGVTYWKDIVGISAGAYHTVGLKADGTVVATTYNKHKPYYGQCDVSEWKDIVAISAGDYHTVGLKSDGTVVATNFVGECDKDHGQCDVSEWKDIVAISAGRFHTVGLRADGTVVGTTYSDSSYHGQCAVYEWKDIVAVSAGAYHTVGLRSDGTVVATDYMGEQADNRGQCNVSKWRGIVAISAGTYHTVGLKADGTMVAVGWNHLGQCAVKQMRLFQSVDTLENERAKIFKRREEQIIQLRRERGRCQHCGGEFKGLWNRRCSVCGKEVDY